MSTDRGPSTAGFPEWSADEIRTFGYRVVDLIAEHLAGQPSRPVFRPVPAVLAEEFLSEPAPHHGLDAESILAEFLERVEPFPFGNGHPRFYGWVNSPPTPIGIFAEALATAMNPSCAGGNHAAIYVERLVLEWFKTLTGLPSDSMGLLVSGGSMATLTALAVARQRAASDARTAGLQGRTARLAVYQGSEGHSCIQKAVELLGIGSQYLRRIRHDRSRRLDVEALEKTIRSDLDSGIVPMAVIASAGTVNTGAIDPLAQIADVCSRFGIWMHVDGAYGAPAMMTDEFREELAPLARADSIALDPHKWLYVPVEAGLLLVRDASLMHDTFSLVPAYLRTTGSSGSITGPPWFSEYGFQQTRAFRALKVWMALKHHGLEGYRAAIEHDIGLARYLASQILRSVDFELAEPQSLSVVCFRYAPPGLRARKDTVDALNSRLVEAIQTGGRAFVSSTSLDGRFWLRACVVNYRARQEDMDALLTIAREAGEALLAATGGATRRW